MYKSGGCGQRLGKAWQQPIVWQTNHACATLWPCWRENGAMQCEVYISNEVWQAVGVFLGHVFDEQM